jgi:hypothetical protein
MGNEKGIKVVECVKGNKPRGLILSNLTHRQTIIHFSLRLIVF